MKEITNPKVKNANFDYLGNVLVVTEEQRGDPYMTLCISPVFNLQDDTYCFSTLTSYSVSLYSHRVFEGNLGGKVKRVMVASEKQKKEFFKACSLHAIKKLIEGITDEEIDNIYQQEYEDTAFRFRGTL